MFPLGLAGTKSRPLPMEIAPYTLNTTTGNQDITLDPSVGKGKTPIAAMFVQAENTAAGLDDTVGRTSIGFFDGTDSIVIGVASQNNVSTTSAHARGATDEAIMIISANAGSVRIEATGVALIENGVRINIGATTGEAVKGLCLLFFDDDGAAKVDTFASHATENSTVTVTPGIATDALVSVLPSRTADWFDDAAHNNADAGLGFALSDGSQCAADWFDTNGASSSSEVDAHVSTARGAVSSTIGTGVEYNNFTATQFDATTRGAAGGGTVGYLALEMPNAQFWTGVIDTPTATGEQEYTAPGFPVRSLLSALSIVQTADAEITNTTAEAFGVGVATGRRVASAAIASEDNVSTSDTETYYSDANLRAAGADDHNETEVDSFMPAASGFKLNFATAHSTAQKWPVLGIGRA